MPRWPRFPGRGGPFTPTLAGKAEQQAADLADQAQRIEREQQAAEIERLRAALADAQQGRTAAEQQAAVLAAKLEACAERVARAEARVEQIEQQAAEAREQAKAQKIERDNSPSVSR